MAWWGRIIRSEYGIPLHFGNALLGVLTLDSLEPHEFDFLDAAFINTLGELSARFLHTALYIEKLDQQHLHTQHVLQAVSEQVSEQHQHGEMIGKSEAMEKLKRAIRLAASSELTILIQGESGVGKELVARALHFQSARHGQPLVYVNCAAIASHLTESELFGHVKGAFTSANRDRDGKFLLVDGGTLFLDEIGELPQEIQGTLLRAIQNQEIQVVGQDKSRKVNVRVIAATNRKLEDEVKYKRFRADLYHRLVVFPIYVPTLKERQSDIPLLAGYFAEKTRRSLGLQQLILSDDTLLQLTRYNWPGNVRELEHVVSRAALYAREETPTGITVIKPSHLTGINLIGAAGEHISDASALYTGVDDAIDFRAHTNKF